MSTHTIPSQPDPALAPSVWEAARRDYLAGSTAAEICARHGLGRTAFYARAQAGGWRRRDVEHGPPQYDIIEPPDRSPQAARARRVMAADALNRADQALRLGRLGEVKGWVRVAADLRRLAMEEAGFATWRETLQDALEREVDLLGDGEEEDDDEDGAEAADDVFTPRADEDARPDTVNALSACSGNGICAKPDSPDSFFESAAPPGSGQADLPLCIGHPAPPGEPESQGFRSEIGG